MMYLTILGLHLSTALVTALVIAYSLFVLWRNKSEHYKWCALVLGAIAGFEVLSGTALALVSPQLSALSLTIHIAEYLGVCAIAEALLFARMRKASITFPLAAAASPALASTLLFAVVVALGF